MSYILEALRRADADRQRGAVPGLHAQPPAPPRGDTPADGPARYRRTGLTLLLGSGLALALAAAWWLGRGAAPDLPPPAQVQAQPPATAQQPALPAAATVVVPKTAEAAAPVAPLPASLVPAPAVALATPAAAAVVAAAPASAAVASAPAVPAAPPTAAASTPEPLVRWAALPESVRSSLPPLALSGGVYADQPAQRLLIVNGQVAREGDELSPGLRLEQIRPRSAVLRWRGQRFEMPL